MYARSFMRIIMVVAIMYNAHYIINIIITCTMIVLLLYAIT